LIVLRPWQHEILHGLFGRKGEHRHRTAYIGLPRKNGKSTIGAALALYGLIADGEEGAEVYSCAGDRTQARIVFEEAKRMVLAEPELSAIVKVYRWHMEGPRNSIYRALSADAKLQQGLNPSFVIFDEVHVQPNFDLWTAMTMGTGTRVRPLVIGITTAGFDKTTLAWDLYERGQAGELYFRWFQPADPNADWLDHAVWAEANPALGDFLFPEALAEDAKHESSFRRYHLNQWTSTHTAWLPHGAWDAIRADRTIGDEPIVLGFDGAWSNDSTALVGCTIRDPHLFVLGLWTPDQDLGHVDLGQVERGVRDALARYHVRALAFDPARFQDFYARLELEGFPLIEWQTNSLPRMVPACQEFYTAVIEHRLTHDGDPRLAQHIANAVLREDHRGPRIVKESKTSPRKIDLAVAAVIAHDMARRTPDVEGPVFS
jgi:phage terminase large subunit-like protein